MSKRIRVYSGFDFQFSILGSGNLVGADFGYIHQNLILRPVRLFYKMEKLLKYIVFTSSTCEIGNMSSLLEQFRKSSPSSGNSEAGKTQSEKEFNQKILSCIRSGLEIFGKNIPQVVQTNMTWLCGLKWEEIPNKPEDFEKGMGKIFRSGSVPVMRSIMSEINSAFSLSKDYDTLKDSITAARNKTD